MFIYTYCIYIYHVHIHMHHCANLHVTIILRQFDPIRIAQTGLFWSQVSDVPSNFMHAYFYIEYYMIE